jgi:hypothetical protein
VARDHLRRAPGACHRPCSASGSRLTGKKKPFVGDDVCGARLRRPGARPRVQVERKSFYGAPLSTFWLGVSGSLGGAQLGRRFGADRNERARERRAFFIGQCRLLQAGEHGGAVRAVLQPRKLGHQH